MTGPLSRLIARLRGEADQQAVELSRMSPKDRAFAEESPAEHLFDERARESLGGAPEGPSDPDDPSSLLSGPTS